MKAPPSTDPVSENSPCLSRRLDGHDNNFNLIRVTAALMVLVSRSFPVVTGFGNTEPLRLSHGVTPGSIAVDIFFIVSGLLVSLLLTAYLLGPVVSSLGPAT